MFVELLLLQQLLDKTGMVTPPESNSVAAATSTYQDAILRERAKQPTVGSKASLGGRPLQLLHPRAPVGIKDLPTSTYKRIDRY